MEERFPFAGRRIGAALIVVAALSGVACGGGSQQASRESSPPQASQPAAPASDHSIPLVDSRGQVVSGMPSAAPVEAGGGLIWTVPSSWIEEPPASSMRKAQYSLPAAPGDPEPGQCAVFYFGVGQGGDIQANVDRWAAQFVDAAGGHPAPTVTQGTVAGRKVMKVTTEGTYTPSPMMGGDMTPKPGQKLLGAIVEGPDSNWFFKCTGPKKTVELHREEFDALIGSVRTR
ncbi:MAG: hypothetical protein L0Z52_08705 [Acidobacteria bacterium]|nr:hypothetical protein [Acidobacteriota bacterium]